MDPLSLQGTKKSALEGVVMSVTGLTVTKPLSEHEVLHVAKTLHGLFSTLSWAIADFLNYVEETHGDMVYAIADIFSLSIGTLRNMTYTARRFPPHTRSEKLTFSHHRVLASQPDDMRAALLKQAEESAWSVEDLRRNIIVERARLAKTRADMLPLPFAEWFTAMATEQNLSDAQMEFLEKYCKLAFIAGRRYEHERMSRHVKEIAAKNATYHEIAPPSEADYVVALSSLKGSRTK